MLKMGLFAIGLDTYWSQFEGLYDRLKGYLSLIESNISSQGVNVVNAGMVDNYEKAEDVGKLFRLNQVDGIVLFISTYALSKNVLPILQNVKVPLLILNLQPEDAIDYENFNLMGDRGKMTGEWLAYCQSCVAPEIASVLNRSAIKYHLITGVLNEEIVWKEVSEYLDAQRIKNGMSTNRVGLLGNYYNGMLDVYSDVTQLSAVFGSQFEIIEMGALKMRRDSVSIKEVLTKIKDFRKSFDVHADCDQYELERAAKTAIAMEKLITDYKLNSLAYYYEATGDNSYLDIVTSLIPGLTLLTGRNKPIAGEYEIKNVLAMKILDLLGIGGSFSEFYAMDFKDNIILLGHDGPAHFAIADGKVSLVPLPVYHGKPGKGLSIQMKVKCGPVTLLSVCQHQDGNISLLVAEAVSEDGPTLQIGNTNSRYRFSIGIREFINEWSKAGPSHHCAIGVGHKARVIIKYAELLGIQCKQVC